MRPMVLLHDCGMGADRPTLRADPFVNSLSVRAWAPCGTLLPAPGRPCREFASDTAQAFGLLPSLRPWRCAWAPCTQASIGTIRAAPKTHAQSACSPIPGVLRTAFPPSPRRSLPIRQPFLRSGRWFLPYGRVTPTGPERRPSPDRQRGLNCGGCVNPACGLTESGDGR